MAKIVVVVDCQNDFIDGALGTPEAQDMIFRLIKKIKNEQEDIIYIFTRDTHYEDDYLISEEGKALPFHCEKYSKGWEIPNELINLFKDIPLIIEKNTFGSIDLMDYLEIWNNVFDEIEFVGLFTDMCVLSNAIMAKTYFPKAIISVDSSCCAGSTSEMHDMALEIMRNNNIFIK